MRFRLLKIVTTLVILGVLTLAVSVAFLRLYVFPAPPGKGGHSSNHSIYSVMAAEDAPWIRAEGRVA